MQLETSPTHPEIRPGLDALRTLPSICQIEEDWGRIELKLETADTRYWVTTRGLPVKSGRAETPLAVGFSESNCGTQGNGPLKALHTNPGSPAGADVRAGTSSSS